MITNELVEGYKATQEQLKQSLKDNAARTRILEKQVKEERQIEMRLKRQIEALGTLITDNTPKVEAKPEETSAQPEEAS